jgi:PIN domain
MLVLHHKDPFDRMLAAQAQAENLPIISNDPVFARYGVRRILVTLWRHREQRHHTSLQVIVDVAVQQPGSHLVGYHVGYRHAHRR